jgi:hypothetical protein
VTTKRERLDTLTASMQTNIDDTPARLVALDTAIAATTADIATTQAAVDTITAIPSANRTAAQRLDLGYQRQVLALQRATKDTQQLSKKLVRDIVVVSRYGLALDGSRLRDSDLTGTE